MAMFTFDHADCDVGLPVSQKIDNGLADRLSAMDIDIPISALAIEKSNSTSSPLAIASPTPVRRADMSNLDNGPRMELHHDKVHSKTGKRKKRKNKCMKPVTPAMQVIRGFETPVTSGGEESDYSGSSTPMMTPRLMDLPSITSSPAMRPASAMGGISSLKFQLETLNLDSNSPRASSLRRIDTTSSSTSLVSGTTSDSDKTEMDTYQVELANDFISPDVVPARSLLPNIEGGLRQDTMYRKMTASDFDTLRCLGKGAYGTVLLVKQRATGRLFAQKQLRKATLTVHKKLVEQTRTERQILESVSRHPFVVKLFYAFQDHEKLYLILEYAQGGELFHHLSMESMFNEETASFYMAEMVLALEHLHRNLGVIYRDLKPENCLLDSEGHLLLTDFGLSKVAVDETDRCNSILGTIEYMAPEVIMGAAYSFAVDWWSLGALGFDLLTGSPPFGGNNHAKIQNNILKQKLQLPYFLGPDAKDLLTRLLRKEPHKRLGYNMPKDLQTIKNHRFFRKIDWRRLERREVDPPIKPLITDPELAENFAKEFTDLAVSPTVSKRSGFWDEGDGVKVVGEDEDREMFGGFSFVASESLLEGGFWREYE
ncbi:kinase-like protein [Patellaria atrata CBS 101060]|uniref:Kinase-like protein n=1 Tax=Patellaria atrata CBS 101060 TaxID=1346257 RepID=A0A9P4S4I6_9PEZI|nr:kinase-like protein [Patellaria atrata CBS 101060]